VVFFEELLGRFLVATTLHQDIEDVSVLVDGTPEIVPFTGDREEHFGQVPLVPRPGPGATQLIGICLAKLPAPFADGLIGHEHAMDEQEFLICWVVCAPLLSGRRRFKLLGKAWAKASTTR
jgi:hypothetical protein